MNTFLLAFALLFSFQTTSSDSVTAVSEIEQVTVFQNQAQIQRNAEVDLKKGTTTIVFTNLSENLIDRSVQLRGNGAFTLLSLTTRNEFTEKTIWKDDVQQLRDQRVVVQEKIKFKQAALRVIQSEITLLNSTQNIINNNKLTAAELADLMTVYRTNLSSLFNSQIELNTELSTLQNELQLLNRKINESGQIERNSYKEVIAEILLEQAQDIKFVLDYQVYNAGWQATYDLRSKDIDSPLEITYKANIYQNTGVDWKDVKFVINSGDPSSNATKPELETNYVGYQTFNQPRKKSNSSGITLNRNNETGIVRGRVFDATDYGALPAVTVQIIETNIGTVTNADGSFQLPHLNNGNYTLKFNFIGYNSITLPLKILNNGYYVEVPLEQDVLGFEEVVVTGRSSARIRGVSETKEIIQATKVIQNIEITNQTSFSYEIAIPYSVPSDGKMHTVEIKKESPKTDYNYSATPKLSSSAYLIGSFPEWYSLNLIEGDANIYFDNRFVGSSFLDPLSASDTLDISLGKDEQIVIEREQLREFASKNFFKSKVRENKTFEIRIRNSKTEPITITVEDQIPVSTNEEIKVSPKELSGGKLNEETGIITWEITLNPGETKNLRFGFELEYPKGKRVVF